MNRHRFSFWTFIAIFAIGLLSTLLFKPTAAQSTTPVVLIGDEDQVKIPAKGLSLNSTTGSVDENFVPDPTPAGARITSAFVETFANGEFLVAKGILDKPNAAMSICAAGFKKVTDAIPGLPGQRFDERTMSCQLTPLPNGSAEFEIRFPVYRDESGKVLCYQYDIFAMAQQEFLDSIPLIHERFDLDLLFFHWRRVFIAALHFPQGSCSTGTEKTTPEPITATPITPTPIATPSPVPSTTTPSAAACLSLSSAKSVLSADKKENTTLVIAANKASEYRITNQAGQVVSTSSSYTYQSKDAGVYTFTAEVKGTDGKWNSSPNCSKTIIVKMQVWMPVIVGGFVPPPTPSPSPTPAPCSPTIIGEIYDNGDFVASFDLSNHYNKMTGTDTVVRVKPSNNLKIKISYWCTKTLVFRNFFADVFHVLPSGTVDKTDFTVVPVQFQAVLELGSPQSGSFELDMSGYDGRYSVGYTLDYPSGLPAEWYITDK